MTKKKKIRLIIILVVLTVLQVGIAFSSYLFAGDDLKAVVTLNGGPEITWEYGTEFHDPGAEGRLFGSPILRAGTGLSVTSEGTVDVSTPGTYTLTYTASALGVSGTATRTVEVVDTVPPEITLVSNGEPAPDRPYQEEGFTATDNCDGDITHLVVRTEQPGLVIYTVKDASGNETVKERVVPAIDVTPPVITLEGGTDLHIPAGVEYEDPGYSASDDFLGDVTDRVTVSGDVCWYMTGSYPVTYRVSDDRGNETSLVRNVTVEPQARPEIVKPEGKTVYLTFDDGPGPDTERLLDILKKYDVKATFFVIDTEYNEIMKRIVEEGHSIGAHSVTHKYRKVYASKDAFFQDLLGIQQIIKDNAGVTTTLMRFPGGSSNRVSQFNPGIMSYLVKAVQDAGFQYFDWNVDSNDAGGSKSTDAVYNNVIKGLKSHDISVVLQHDVHSYSVDAVERIIQWGLKNGYQFLPLKPDSFNAHHTLRN